ncbi:serine hydrolase domain-containing protein [Mycobacterium xenopi]|uniref:Beta-lactamase-related domain-containing protein n=1 Tax=Mycobacterium xenopi TaxID=1789 RepID=A0AAD1H2N1_MYCXE|nr:serine hydrolase domain-containing protein [Mycobacterium xenopi]EID17027.1 putative lipoprotein [Mycobacterium xenopi RIVM700367]MDA3640971.1 serine hydrolase [Mycobacterium xenopi]MDA3660095.1 serine hydrolase [Mycobacterium xenopi]MDA3662820.1 serine hydrolase [Mycobacterium xenopi]ORX19457.1 D-alanyl-D-alanine carboxypeptidase [Mycobacterium xenopi]
MTISRRLGSVVCILAVAVLACSPKGNPPVAPWWGASANPAKARAVMKIVGDTMTQAHLKAAIVRVTVDGKEIVTQALGESMTGVPAMPSMFFRNGAVAISYIATLLLKLVDEKKLSLDDKLSKWLPDIPNADRVTLGQLAHMTSGYRDYALGNADFDAALAADPFRQWTPEEVLGYAVTKPLLYEPGTNWNYARTNYVLLGLALEKATGQEMPKLLHDRVLGPLALINTANSYTPDIPVPTLHAFTSERRRALGIPSDTPFYEDSTYWNPSWTMARGAVQTTNIYDLEATAVGIGSGKLLSPQSYRAMVSPDLRGKVQGDTYGLGIVISGNWLLQNPMFAGQAAVEAYLPSQRIAIAVAVTYRPDAFDAQGNYRNEAETLFRKIGAEMAPNDAPPVPAVR